MTDMTTSSVSPEEQAVMNQLEQRFAVKEAEFLAEHLPLFLPKWLIKIANRPATNWKVRAAIDIMGLILAIRRVRVERNTHYGMQGGKGFRTGVQFQTIDAVTSKIMHGPRVVAEKRFEIGHVITKTK